LQAFVNGLAVVGYERDAHGNGTFLLGAWDQEQSNPGELCGVIHD
jgi:hypothetical protein